MRRLAPRPLAEALEAVAARSAPPGSLARVQAAWGQVAGPVAAAESEPATERDGVVTVRCSSAVWAQELELLGRELLPRLNAVLGPDQEVRELRFTAGGGGLRRGP